MDEMAKKNDAVDFWGAKNEDKQDLSMDWSHDGHFWIAMNWDKADEVLAIVRQFLSDKFGGDWSERPSARAKGRYVEEKHGHYLFADYGRKEAKERFAEVHATETGRTIFVRFWHDLFEDAKAALQSRGFKYHPQIPDEHQVNVPGLEISPEKAAALEKFRTSQPLDIPEGAFEGRKGGAGGIVGIAVLVIIVAAAAVLLRKPIGQLFIREEPLNLGNLLVARSQMAAFEKLDGSMVYILANTEISDRMKADVQVYGDLIDSSRTDFYTVHKLVDQEGTVLYQADEGASVSIPSFIEGQDLAKYRAVDAGDFQYDRKTGWEKLQGESVTLQGALQEEPDGYYLKVSDGLIKLETTDPFTLLNLQIAQKKGKAITVYGTIGETFDWKTVRKETRKMFQLRVDPVSYTHMTSL